MGFFVLGLEVKDVDTKADVGKVRIQLDVLRKGAIVVEKNVVRFDRFDMESTLEEFLRMVCVINDDGAIQRSMQTYSYTGDSLSTKHRVSPKDHATGCYCELLIVRS